MKKLKNLFKKASMVNKSDKDFKLKLLYQLFKLKEQTQKEIEKLL